MLSVNFYVFKYQPRPVVVNSSIQKLKFRSQRLALTLKHMSAIVWCDCRFPCSCPTHFKLILGLSKLLATLKAKWAMSYILKSYICFEEGESCILSFRFPWTALRKRATLENSYWKSENFGLPANAQRSLTVLETIQNRSCNRSVESRLFCQVCAIRNEDSRCEIAEKAK